MERNLNPVLKPSAERVDSLGDWVARALYQEALDTIQALRAEVAQLKEQIALMQRQIFGKRSERQKVLGEEVRVESLIKISDDTRKAASAPKVRVDLSGLRRVVIEHDLPEEEQSCSGCHQALKRMGSDRREQINMRPAELFVEEHIRYKYVCQRCDQIIMAPQPRSALPKALAGESLITEIVLNKYQLHLPLYRQSLLLKQRYGIALGDHTLGGWVLEAGAGLLPIYEALWKEMSASGYLQVDETPVKLLKPDKQGYLWTYYAPELGQGLVLFECKESRSGSHAQEKLASFEGILQTDAYQGYDRLRRSPTIKAIGCWTHMRRKFEEVLQISQNSEGVAAQVLERLKPLYALEAEMRTQQLKGQARQSLREAQVQPQVEDLKHFLEEKAQTTPPKSRLGGAIAYALNQWPFLEAYVHEGRAEIDTNWVENRIRPVALGRKNWLFMNSEATGLIHSLWYSLISSALLNALDPRVYVHYLLTQIHDLRAHRVSPAGLLPHRIDAQLLKDFEAQERAWNEHVDSLLAQQPPREK